MLAQEVVLVLYARDQQEEQNKEEKEGCFPVRCKMMLCS